MLQRLNVLFVLAGCFQVHLGHQYPGLPSECFYPPQIDHPEECCELDPFYSIIQLNSCAANVSKDSADCDTLLCLLRLRDYVNEKNELLLDKVSEGLDKWASGTVFEQKLPKIKQICMKAPSSPEPPHVCGQARTFQCMGSLWTSNCPEEKWMKTEDCATLKKHLQLCGPPPL